MNFKNYSEIEIYTIGHSNYPIEKFVALLKKHNIQTIVDVRSAPYSKYNPQHNRENLQKSLGNYGITYVFLGNKLGARRENPDLYTLGKDGKYFIDFEKVLNHDKDFSEGIRELIDIAISNKACIMCAEKEPLYCHRTQLVSRKLWEEKITVLHLLEDGSTISQKELELKLVEMYFGTNNLFFSQEELIKLAYKKHNEIHSYKREKL